MGLARRLYKNKKIMKLKNYENLKGLLYPLSKGDTKKYRTKIGLSTDDGRDFIVLCSKQWNLTLWRHLWDHVTMYGKVDYSKRTIQVQSLFLDDLDLSEQYEGFGDFNFDSLEALRWENLIKRGYSIPVAG